MAFGICTMNMCSLKFILISLWKYIHSQSFVCNVRDYKKRMVKLKKKPHATGFSAILVTDTATWVSCVEVFACGSNGCPLRTRSHSELGVHLSYCSAPSGPACVCC